ncbi:Nidogen-like protein, partial [Ancylostoma duodenale]
VLSNGAIGFEANARTYKAGLFPSGARLIAPFWNRNDLRKGGHVYYREVTKGRVLERGQSEIRYQYDRSVHVKSAVIVTWEKMQPLEGTAALPEENTNTFQAALFITDNGTYANFIYSNIGWTQGAEAGFNRGDNSEHYALPTSGTGNIMYLEEYGNTGIPGEWMFELGETRVVRCKQGIKGDTCDEDLRLLPLMGSCFLLLKQLLFQSAPPENGELTALHVATVVKAHAIHSQANVRKGVQNAGWEETVKRRRRTAMLEHLPSVLRTPSLLRTTTVVASHYRDASVCQDSLAMDTKTVT